jgi:hypothetical protein
VPSCATPRIDTLGAHLGLCSFANPTGGEGLRRLPGGPAYKTNPADGKADNATLA